MATFNHYLDELKEEIMAFAEADWKQFKNAAVADGDAFVERLREDLENWTAKLVNGDLSQGDFAWLVAGKKDLAELEALKQTGLIQARLENFVNGLVDVVVNTAVKVFLV
jgi:hypothetical protein